MRNNVFNQSSLLTKWRTEGEVSWSDFHMKIEFSPFYSFSFFLSLQWGLTKKREREKMQKNPFVDLSTLMQR
jgi:hypothetical protein